MSLISPVTRTRAFVGGIVLASVSAIAIAAAPVGAQTSSPSTPCPSGPPVLQVGNPNPGDVLSQGDYIFSGVAFDPASTDGSGISHVDLFIGNRNDGGTLVASTPVSGHQYEVKGTVPANLTGGRDFFAYAVSSVTGQQTTVSFPIFVGAAPTPTASGGTAPTPVPATESMQSTCSASASSVVQVSAPAPSASSVVQVSAPAPSASSVVQVSAPAPSASSVMQVSAPAPSSPGSQITAPAPMGATEFAPVLSLGNPSSGDVLPFGDVFINGVAFDPTATQGAGIDRVELFLDNRDSGGSVVGIGTPAADHTFSIKVTLHSNESGGHAFFAYARSSVTGQETVTSVPVFVGISPTATPRPTNS